MVVSAAACCVLRAADDDTTRLRKLFADDQAWEMRNNPEEATLNGYPGQNDRWSDLSRAAIESRRRHPDENLKVLHTIDRAKLAPEDQLNYDLFRWDNERKSEGAAFPEEFLDIIGPMGGVHSLVPMVLQHSPTGSVQDYEDELKRLHALGRFVDQNIALLREGLARGITQPKIVLRDIPAQVDALLQQQPSASILLKSFADFPSAIPPAEQERLRRAANALIDGEVYPAFRRYRDFLAKDYIPHSRETIGMSSLPNGEAWFHHRTVLQTTTQLTPREIHEIGLKEVARIHGAMEQIIQTTGFHGSFSDFVQFLRTDPRFYYKNDAELVAGYRDICKRIDEKLPKLFGKLPRTPYGVEPMDAYSAPSQTTAYYEPGPVDGSMPGIYRVNTYKLDSRPKFEMEVLSVHESVPGHHLQIALAHELENVPEFRRNLETTAFVEGWGLYSESLGYEIGLYQDPYSKFGQLSYEMWRACRLVVDTGMHALGWSRQQAIDFMKANTALTEQNIVVEVDRYISWPGQADAYKIGQLKIRELRTRAERELGARFEERKFHDVLLGEGALPLSILEQRVDAWLAGQQR